MIKSHEYKYLFAYTGFLVAFVSFYFGGAWSFSLVIYAFVVVPLIEVIFPPFIHNMSRESEEKAKNNRIFDFMLYANVPMQYCMFFLFLYKVSRPDCATLEMVGYTLSAAMIFGFGINIAHELGHRHTWYERVMSRSILLHSLYMHFLTEHNNWHHRWVATPKDPASSEMNEVVYTFWVKSIVGTYINAWKLETERLKKAGKGFFSFDNQMIGYQLIQIGLVVAIYFVFGQVAMVCFLFAALGGVLNLETVNYIEHYGLRRKEIQPGVYEMVKPVHSWNSDHIIGRIMLFELTRHSDHHYKASRKYQILRHFEESPQMPTGYPGSMLLSLVPPVWFWVMNKRAAAFNEQLSKAEAERLSGALQPA